jgi:hypothetical protein
VKRQRLHVVVVDEIFSQFRNVGVQHPLGGGRMDVALAVVTGVEQQRRAALDADIAQAQEQGAERLAMTLDAKQFVAGIGPLDLGLEILAPATLAVSFGGGGKRRGRDQDEDKNSKSSHGQPARFVMDDEKIAAIDESVIDPVTTTMAAKAVPSRKGASSRRLPAGAMIAVRRKQMHVPKHPAHGEIPEIASDGPANGKNDDVGGMILAAPPQHPADPEDGEENRAELQSPCLIHDIPPMAGRTPS